MFNLCPDRVTVEMNFSPRDNKVLCACACARAHTRARVIVCDSNECILAQIVEFAPKN